MIHIIYGRLPAFRVNGRPRLGPWPVASQPTLRTQPTGELRVVKWRGRHGQGFATGTATADDASCTACGAGSWNNADDITVCAACVMPCVSPDLTHLPPTPSTMFSTLRTAARRAAPVAARAFSTGRRQVTAAPRWTRRTSSCTRRRRRTSQRPSA